MISGVVTAVKGLKPGIVVLAAEPRGKCVTPLAPIPFLSTSAAAGPVTLAIHAQACTYTSSDAIQLACIP